MRMCKIITDVTTRDETNLIVRRALKKRSLFQALCHAQSLKMGRKPSLNMDTAHRKVGPFKQCEIFLFIRLPVLAAQPSRK
jgi:hypothetical protein